MINENYNQISIKLNKIVHRKKKICPIFYWFFMILVYNAKSKKRDFKKYFIF
jgi:hypothetical protein